MPRQKNVKTWTKREKRKATRILRSIKAVNVVNEPTLEVPRYSIKEVKFNPFSVQNFPS